MSDLNLPRQLRYMPGAFPSRVRRTEGERACGLLVRVALGLSIAFAALPALAGGPWRAAAPNTTGWQFMSPEERVEHQRIMRSFTRYEDCKAYQAEHHARMAERARQAGVVLQPRAESACEQLRARGRLQ